MLETHKLASRILDRWLEKTGPDGKARLHQFGAGKSIRVRSFGGSFDCLIEIDDQRVGIVPVPPASTSTSTSNETAPSPLPRPADLDISFSLAIASAPILGLPASQWRERQWLVINGDLNFAEQLLEISHDMPSSAGDLAQTLVGKTGAVALDRLLGLIRESFRLAVENLRMDVVDYLQYEGEVLTDPQTCMNITEQIGQLHQDIESLSERLKVVENQAKSSAKPPAKPR